MQKKFSLTIGINLHADTLDELTGKVQELTEHLTKAGVDSAPPAAPAPAAKSGKTGKPAAAPKKESEPEESEDDLGFEAEEDEPAPAPTPDEVVEITLEEVIDAFRNYAIKKGAGDQKKGREAAKKVLESFGVTNTNKLDPTQYADVLKKLGVKK